MLVYNLDRRTDEGLKASSLPPSPLPAKPQIFLSSPLWALRCRLWPESASRRPGLRPGPVRRRAEVLCQRI